MFCLESFKTIANGGSKFLSFSFQLQGLHYSSKKKLRFVECLLFYPKNEVIAFPKIELQWDWVSDVHIYIKSDAVIWFWKHCHVRTRQTSEN